MYDFKYDFRSGNDNFSRLQQAKLVIDSQYLLVGVTEDLSTFFEILENLIPKVFLNALNIYKKIGEFNIISGVCLFM